MMLAENELPLFERPAAATDVYSIHIHILFTKKHVTLKKKKQYTHIYVCIYVHCSKNSNKIKEQFENTSDLNGENVMLDMLIWTG